MVRGKTPLVILSVVAVVGIALGAWLLIANLASLSCRTTVKTASANTQAACNEVSRKFVMAQADQTFSPDKQTAFQSALLEIVLDHYEGVEGGFWSADQGFSAYAFPTYEGSGKKTDFPTAERSSIEKTIQQSQFRMRLWSDTLEGRREAVVRTACPVHRGVSVWMMERAPLLEDSRFTEAKQKLTLLFAGLSTSVLMLLGFGWLASLKVSRRFGNLQRELGDEKEISARNDRLKMVGEMSAGLAHDLREPIGALRLGLENAKVDPANRAARALPLAIEQVDRLDRFVEMMLAFTRPFRLKLESVDIGVWLETGFTTVKSRARDKQIHLETRSAVKTWTFDPFQLARAITNLLENAVHFTPSGGLIKLEINEQQSRLVIEISDTGPGPSDEAKKALFRTSKSERIGGTGLGLLLAKEIVELHGGSIELIERPKTLFKMVIP